MLTARRPGIDLDKADLVWSRVPEFALFFNGIGAAITHVEHFLNSVISEVRQNVADSDPALADELTLFIEQEKNHTAYHERFNKRLVEEGYAELRPLLREIALEFGRIRRTKSLAFCAAYCTGSEILAAFTAQNLLEKSGDLLEGAEPNGANLLLWHLAEEFEHRSVCHDAFDAISGNYFLRIWGVLYSYYHANSCFARCRGVILAKYWAGLSKAERSDSQRRYRKVLIRQTLYTLPRLLRLLNPFFHPKRLKATRRVEKALAMYSGKSSILQTHYAEEQQQDALA